jgi:hypothetical protein
MQSRAFKRRAEALQKHIIAEVSAGKPMMPFAEIATHLGLPLDVVTGGFAHSVAKNLGEIIVPVGKVS